MKAKHPAELQAAGMDHNKLLSSTPVQQNLSMVGSGENADFVYIPEAAPGTSAPTNMASSGGIYEKFTEGRGDESTVH
jgi:hypothetical protein